MTEPWENMETIRDAGGATFTIYYAYCRCNVWPMALEAPRGRCGNCGTSPVGLYATREEAETAYHEPMS